MDPATFVRQLVATAPKKERLVALGLSEAEAADFARSYVCMQKPQAGRTSAVANSHEPLLKLISEWDLHNVEIGIVEFLDIPRTTTSGDLQVGKVEADALVISQATDEVVVVDHEARDRVLWKASKTGGQLLDALIVVAQFLTRCLLQEVRESDSHAVKEVADMCAAYAGGDEYRPFYAMLLGEE